MRVLVACDGLETAPSMSRCTSVMCYMVEGELPVDSRNIPAIDTSPNSIAEFLDAVDADVFLSGNIDTETAALIQSHGVEVAKTTSKDPLSAVKEYLATLYE